MPKHAVVIAGGGPTGLMLAGELALARVDVAVVERRETADLAGARSRGLHARTIEVLDQRGIAERFLSQGKVAQVASFASIPLDIGDFPTRHPYGLAVAAAWSRFKAAGLKTLTEENTECCYALQDKVWVEDPDGNSWEVFVVKGDAPEMGKAVAARGCCAPKVDA